MLYTLKNKPATKDSLSNDIVEPLLHIHAFFYHYIAKSGSSTAMLYGTETLVAPLSP